MKRVTVINLPAMTWRTTRRWAAVAAFNLAAIALVLGAAELGVRLMSGADRTDQDDQLPMCRADPLTVWRYKPDVRLTYRAPEFEMQVRTNEEGLRSAATSAGPGPTVLFIGDSFTFGWGVSEAERYTDAIGRQLGGVRTVNAGHWMYTFDQQLLLMRQLIERHRPAVVVQGFYWMSGRCSTTSWNAMRMAPCGRCSTPRSTSIRAVC